MADHLATYGSANLRVLFMDNEKGKNIKTDTLFENIIFKKYRNKDEHFNPKKFLEEVDQEKYFELLRTWKQDSEKSYLDENPHLRFSPVRHKKCLMSKRRPCIK